ncbi:MAG: hypothetical protein IJD91_04065 [Clostridia bacterium]|nr:hypothetical protein [Clostridia bacterium]
MTKEDIIAIFYRLGEMLLGSVFMSALVCYLCTSTKYMPVESHQRDITLMILPIIYLIWNVFRLRGFFVVVAEKKIYLAVNLCATALFILISLISYNFIPEELYSWLFLATYLGGFTNLGISGEMSILLFYAVIMVTIFLSPINMGWVQEEIEEINDSFENLPPEMKIASDVVVLKKSEDSNK